MNARTSPPIESSGLTRDLRLADVTMIGVGAMIGAGIFVLTGIAAGTAGPALLLVFALNGIVATITAMAYAELGACFPEAGGGYLWVKEGLPGPNGFLSGWMSWFAHAVACSLYSLGFGAYFGQLLSALNISIPGVHGHMLTKALAIVVCLLFTFINFLGSSETGKAGNIVTITKLLILGLFILSGLWALRGIPDWSARFVPFIPKGMSGVFMAMGLTFIAFEGYEIIAQSGEEVRDPRRNIPLAIFISLGIVVPIYLLIAFVSIGAIQPEGNVPTWEYLGAHAELAVLEAAKQFMPLGQVLLLFGGLVSTMSAMNATIFSSSRVAFAMGRDHNLPAIFARIHPKRHTPHVAIFLSSAIIIFMAITLPIEDVATAADIMFLLLFLQVNFAVITLRYRRPDLNRSFRVPLFPYLPIIGSISQIFLAVIMWFYSPTAWYSCIAWLGLGLIVYYTYAQRLEREAVGSKIVMEERPLTRRRYRILVGVTNPRSVPHLVTLAGAIAKANDGDVVVLHVAPVPRQLPLRDGRQFIAQSKPLFEMAEHVGAQMDVPLYTTVRISHSIPQAIIEAAHETDADFLLLGWRGRPRHALLGETLDAVIRDAPCDVGVLKSVGA
ncbi:MAG TPA: amino acid permease, partial [Armatimonadetes bacterium]|nr:amino acid permease [Armatimonadota bacterium]